MTAQVEARAVLHADLDAFFASVEQRDNPDLRGRPVIVGPGVVMAASYEARRRGVRSAMSGAEARRLCPEAIVVPPRFEAYSAASKAVLDIFRQTSPLVETVSIDEAFIDVSGLRRVSGEPAGIAAALRARVRAEVGLPVTVGVATTKFLAKVASQVGKPDGLLVVHPGTELTFLHPLPVEKLWGVGPVTARKLHDCGLRRIGELASAGEAALISLVGANAGRHLYALSTNTDPRRVRAHTGRRSVGAQSAMGRGRHTPERIDEVLTGLVDRVSRRLRKAERQGRTIVLSLRFEDYRRATRSRTLLRPTDRTDLVLRTARELLAEASALVTERGLTLVGVAVSNLGEEDAAQLTLPFGEESTGADRTASALDAAVDRIRERFGNPSVGRARTLGRDLEHDTVVPVLPITSSR